MGHNETSNFGMHAGPGQGGVSCAVYVLRVPCIHRSAVASPFRRLQLQPGSPVKREWAGQTDKQKSFGMMTYQGSSSTPRKIGTSGDSSGPFRWRVMEKV